MTQANSGDDRKNSSETVQPGEQRQPGIFELAWPTMLTNLLFTMVGIVTMKVVGQLSSEAIAAVGIGQQIFFGLQAILMAISAGTTALVARAWGARKYEEAVSVTLTSLYLGGLVSIALCIPVIIFAPEVASMFGFEESSTLLAAEYIRWLTAFNLAFAITFIMNAAVRAAGDAFTPLWIGLGTNVVNILLVYPLVFGGFGLPALGLAGAALSAGIAFSLGAVAFLSLWIAGFLKLPFKHLNWWHRERFKRLVDIGYPAALEQIVFRIGFFIFFTIIGTWYGSAAFAAYSIGTNLLSVCFVVGFAFSIAGSTLVGQRLGAGDMDGAVRSGWRALLWAEVSMIIMGVAIVVFAEPLARFMIDDEEVIRYTVYFIYILGAMMPLMAIEFAIGGSLRGAGDTRFPLKATMAGLIGMRCTSAAVFAFLGWPVVWIYAALIGDYLVKGGMLLWRFHSGRWKSAVRFDAESDYG